MGHFLVERLGLVRCGMESEEDWKRACGDGKGDKGCDEEL